MGIVEVYRQPISYSLSDRIIGHCRYIYRRKIHSLLNSRQEKDIFHLLSCALLTYPVSPACIRCSFRTVYYINQGIGIVHNRMDSRV
jgi:hypothetical protein